MAQNYLYPRVTISTKALKHSNSQPEAVDTTILFAPMVAERGPAGEVRPIHSLPEFVSVFGELDYDKYGLTALNVANWLNAGGTVYVYRLTAVKELAKCYEKTVKDDGEVDYAKKETEGITSKYRGEYYNGIEVVISRAANSSRYNVLIKKGLTELEKFASVLLANFNSVLGASDYIALSRDFDISTIDTSVKTDKTTEFSKTYKLKNAESDNKDIVVDGSDDFAKIDTMIGKFWSEDAKTAIPNNLEYPIDIVLDACYSKATKESMLNFIAAGLPESPNEHAMRSDIVLILDKHIHPSCTANNISCTFELTDSSKKSQNIAIYDQHMTVEHNGKDIEVGPSYFLASLLPYNDLMYGVQWPTAGVRRGILSGVKKISFNPSPADMNTLFVERINYVQKTSREYAFMSQRTYDGSSDDNFTALSFLNNTRTLHKIRRELERLAREYLFQFNDAITIANMNDVLNRYIAGWIANRTLSSAFVEARKNPYSDEAVDITLTMKFTGTIEVISVDITVQ